MTFSTPESVLHMDIGNLYIFSLALTFKYGNDSGFQKYMSVVSKLEHVVAGKTFSGMNSTLHSPGKVANSPNDNSQGHPPMHRTPSAWLAEVADPGSGWPLSPLGAVAGVIHTLPCGIQSAAHAREGSGKHQIQPVGQFGAPSYMWSQGC